MNDSGKRDGPLTFHCSRTGEMITVDDCAECDKCQSCDIYATMLDEQYDR